jgi:hypothetical protein
MVAIFETDLMGRFFIKPFLFSGVLRTVSASRPAVVLNSPGHQSNVRRRQAINHGHRP